MCSPRIPRCWLELDQRFQVAARSLRRLLRKGCQLLRLPLANSHLCHYMGSVEITRSCFRALLPQTELGLLSPGENWWGCISNIEQLLSVLCSHQDTVAEAAWRLQTGRHTPHRQKPMVHPCSQPEHVLINSFETKDDRMKELEELNKKESTI
uniref:CIDE-N domain-containing protein n=1 Tax=Serinus canaria TaxID=9135 RepID=A0A8C9UHS9_SERCA